MIVIAVCDSLDHLVREGELSAAVYVVVRPVNGFLVVQRRCKTDPDEVINLIEHSLRKLDRRHLPLVLRNELPESGNLVTRNIQDILPNIAAYALGCAR